MFRALSLPAGAVLAASAVLTAGALLGCQAAPPPSPPVPTFDPTTATNAPTTTPAPPRLPASCGDLISTQNIDLALGQPVVGRVRGIVGIPEPNINRLERLTCQYGLPESGLPGPGPIPLEISVSRYADDASAAERVNVTIESERARGAAPVTVPVAAVSGTVLVSSDRRLLVAVNGPVTVAITLAPGPADPRVGDVLSDLGGQVMTAVT